MNFEFDDSDFQRKNLLAIGLLMGLFNPMRRFSPNDTPIDLDKLEEYQSQFGILINKMSKDMDIEVHSVDSVPSNKPLPYKPLRLGLVAQYVLKTILGKVAQSPQCDHCMLDYATQVDRFSERRMRAYIKTLQADDLLTIEGDRVFLLSRFEEVRHYFADHQETVFHFKDQIETA